MSDPTSTEQGIPAPEGPTDLIETDYEIGQDNIHTDRAVRPRHPQSGLRDLRPDHRRFRASITLAFPGKAGAVFRRSARLADLDLRLVLPESANIFVLFCLFLIVSPYGKVRLGGKDATPDYSYTGWFAMLFAAGMGIGLMFYGVSEPISHFSSSAIGGGREKAGADSWAPLGGAAGDNAEARHLGMAATIFHWGLHPWAIYAIVALALALFTYNKGLPLTMRSAFYPIFGERVWGWTGHIIDTLAVFATLFGLATSLGFGAEQANAGLNHIFGIPVSTTSPRCPDHGITAVALISVVRGLDGGVKVLSEINMGLAALLLLFVLIVGPTVAIITGFFTAISRLRQRTCPLSNPVRPRGRQFQPGLDVVLLGVVDLLVALRRHVHRPRQPRAARCASSSSAC
jgi:BCCT family betaine/carnitine transporter